MRICGPLCLIALLLGCTPPAYRLVLKDAVPALVPPGVKPTASQRTVAAGKCPAERITVSSLTAAPAGFLTTRAAELEAQGCLRPGEGAAWTSRILNSLPLPIEVAHRLANPSPATTGYLDLRPGYRLRVISPILREGTSSALDSSASTTTNAAPGGLTVTARASSGLLGYETAVYSVGASALEPRGAEARLGDTLTRAADSRFGYFRFAPGSRLFRMLFLTRSSASDRDALVMAAPSESRLEAMTREVNAAPSRCESADYRGRCVVLPRQVALTAFIVVTVNGAEVLLPPGATVRQAIREASPSTAAAPLVGQLRISRPAGGRLLPVDFSGAEAILGLPLGGGEILIW